jgi:hypothetical protein
MTTPRLYGSEAGVSGDPAPVRAKNSAGCRPILPASVNRRVAPFDRLRHAEVGDFRDIARSDENVRRMGAPGGEQGPAVELLARDPATGRLDDAYRAIFIFRDHIRARFLRRDGDIQISTLPVVAAPSSLHQSTVAIEPGPQSPCRDCINVLKYNVTSNLRPECLVVSSKTRRPQVADCDNFYTVDYFFLGGYLQSIDIGPAGIGWVPAAYCNSALYFADVDLDMCFSADNIPDLRIRKPPAWNIAYLWHSDPSITTFTANNPIPQYVGLWSCEYDDIYLTSGGGAGTLSSSDARPTFITLDSWSYLSEEKCQFFGSGTSQWNGIAIYADVELL